MLKIGSLLSVLAPLFFCISSQSTLADDPTPTTQTNPAATVGITGDWFGLRSRLARDGLTFGGSIVYDYSKNLTGGITTAHDASRELADLTLTVSTDQLLHWHGGTLFIDLQDHEGANGSTSLTGDAQLFDSQDAPRYIQFAMLWYQQTFLDDKFRLKLGRIDANDEFGFPANGSDFLNSSFDSSPAIFAIPTTPDAAPGLDLFWNPNPNFYIGAGTYYSNSSEQSLILSGHPNTVDPTTGGIFSVIEVGAQWNLNKTTLPGRLALGGYNHNGQFKRFTGSTQSGESGMYAILDQTLWQPSATDPANSVGAFAQFSRADSRVALMDENIAAGFQWTGPIPVSSRATDVLGLGPTWVHFSPESPATTRYELAIEGFYKLQLTPWFNIQPDLQYIINPGGTGRPNALVITLRAELDF